MIQKFDDWVSPEQARPFLESGHVWKEDNEGFIDIFAHEHGTHNGPVCTKCGYSKCWHCVPNPPKCTKLIG